MSARPTSSSAEDLRIGGPVVDARALLARLDETDPPQRRQMLRRAAGIEPERVLQGADGVLAVTEQLEDPDPRRMPERAKESALVT